MTSESDEQFVERMEKLLALVVCAKLLTKQEYDRLFALARRGAEAADRIAQLEAALRVFACECPISERCAVPDNCHNFQARRILEGRT